jgi:hypothetical protein
MITTKTIRMKKMKEMTVKEIKEYLIFFTIVLILLVGFDTIMTAYQIDLLKNMQCYNDQIFPNPSSNSVIYQDFKTVDECINALKQREKSVRNSDITYLGEYRKFTIGVKFVQDYEIFCRGIDLINETPIGNSSNRGFVENLCMND